MRANRPLQLPLPNNYRRGLDGFWGTPASLLGEQSPQALSKRCPDSASDSLAAGIQCW